MYLYQNGDIEADYRGLMITASKYDLNNPKKANFKTYAIYWVYEKINRFVRTRNTNEKTSLSISVGEELTFIYGEVPAFN